MGLTIHYTITAPANWTPESIRAKLEEARQFAKTLPVVEVSELATFTGKDAEFRRGREDDEFRWAKIQGQRSILNPWEPGTHGSQSPATMTVFSVYPAEGSEEANFGLCSFTEHVWKAVSDSDPAWSLVFGKRNNYPESRKIIRAFMRRWNLKKLPPDLKHSWSRHRFGGSTGIGVYTDNGHAHASIQRGHYRSHRKGYAGAFGLVTIDDRMKDHLYFKHQGSAEEAERAFASPEFRADLNRMAGGEDFITPAANGQWGSFCKTQYAHDPKLGGWGNFVRAHLSVLAIAEKMRKLGFKVDVSDEGHFWETRDFKVLSKNIGEYDAFIAGMMGVMKDAVGEKGLQVESAMDGRQDFERLEMQAQKGQIGETLKKLAAAIKPPPSK